MKISILMIRNIFHLSFMLYYSTRIIMINFNNQWIHDLIKNDVQLWSNKDIDTHRI